MTPTGIHHFAIQARDLAALVHFYSEVLGLAEVRRWPALGGEQVRSVWLSLGGDGSFLAIERCTGEHAAPEFFDQTAGLHLVALGIDLGERAAWEERLLAAGIEVLHRTPYTLYFLDPEGNRVGLSHYPDSASPQVT